jgi:hypothetical protein
LKGSPYEIFATHYQNRTAELYSAFSNNYIIPVGSLWRSFTDFDHDWTTRAYIRQDGYNYGCRHSSGPYEDCSSYSGPYENYYLGF